MPEVSTLHIYLGTIGMMLTVAVIVHLGLMVSGPAGGFSRWVMRAPGLDILVLLYTALPHVAGPLLGGWAGLGAAIGSSAGDWPEHRRPRTAGAPKSGGAVAPTATSDGDSARTCLRCVRPVRSLKP